MPTKPPRGLKTRKAREFLATNPAGTLKEFTAWSGLTMASSAFSSLRRRGPVREPGPFVPPEPGVKEFRAALAPGRAEALQAALDHERAENAYLRWLVAGERKGWLDRAIDEASESEDLPNGVEAPEALKPTGDTP